MSGTVLQCVAGCCSTSGLQCVELCCSVLQCGVVCCGVLQCVAVCCSVLQCTIDNESPKHISTLHLLPWKTIIVSMKKESKMQRAVCCSRVPIGVATFQKAPCIVRFFC